MKMQNFTGYTNHMESLAERSHAMNRNFSRFLDDYMKVFSFCTDIRVSSSVNYQIYENIGIIRKMCKLAYLWYMPGSSYWHTKTDYVNGAVTCKLN